MTKFPPKPGTSTWHRCTALAVLALALVAVPDAAAQQQPPAKAAEVPRQTEEAAPHKAGEFALPDLTDHWLSWSHFDGPRLSMQMGFAPIIDYTSFSQDAKSIEQVGKQQSAYDLRSGRFSFRGMMKFAHPVTYFLSVEYKGTDRDPDQPAFGLTDWYARTAIGSLGDLSVGKLKEPFVYEMVGDAANLQQQERILSPFFVSRKFGVTIVNTAFDQRMRWQVGWFNDWLLTGKPFNESANDYVGRLTFLPQWADSGARYVHLGVAARYIGPDAGIVRFKGRPESNVADNFVDTGELPADNATALGLEGVWNRGPFMLSSEYTRNWVNSKPEGDPQFWGGYLAASWVLTGEHRAYDRTAGYARRVMPTRKWGAWEIVGRYSHLDMDDRNVAGGILDKWYGGLNWWATRRWKLGVGYGLAHLDRFGTVGTMRSVHSRFQWIY